MEKRWILQDPNIELADSLAREHHLSSLISQVLLNRDLNTSEEITNFLNPTLAQLVDPAQMLGMDKAVERLVKAIAQKQKITIYGDYDVDGTTSTALLMDFFQKVGAEVDYYIPNRLREGYSLNAGAVRELKKRGTQVLITVDNGISARAEGELIKSLGIDLIITDHHEPPEELPPAFAILNPKQKGDQFPDKQLAGVGVAFYLSMALRRGLREAGLLPDREPNLRQALDLVAVGTIADLAPLRGLNRSLVREGLKVLSRTGRLGLRALMEVSGVDGEVRADQVAFRIGPRINAVGRLEDASIGVRLLLSNDQKEARTLAEKLNSANISRQELEDQITQEAMALIESEKLLDRHRGLVVFRPNWHQGVVGIVASRLVDKFYRPSIVLTQEGENCKGSARSISNFNLVEALRSCEDLLLKYGGHAYAAGLTLEKKNLAAFQERFDQLIDSQLKEEDFQPALKVDVESDFSAINEELLDQLKRLEPFGLGNPAPVLMFRKAKVRESRVVGEKHIRLRIGGSGRFFGAIGFRMLEKRPPVASLCDLAFVPEWNEWNGNKNIQLRLLDLRPSPE